MCKVLYLCAAVVALVLVSGCATKPTLSDDQSGCLPSKNYNGSDCGKSNGSAADVAYLGSASIDKGYETTMAGAVENAATVRAAVSRSAAAGADIRIARAMFLPTASLNANAGLVSAQRRPYAGDEPNNPYSYAVTVKLPLYQGGRAKAGLEAARADHRAARDSASDILLSTAFRLAISIAERDRQTAALAVLSRHEGLLRKLRGDVARERNTGDATIVDAGDVDRQLARIAVEKQRTRLQLAEAQRTLTQLHAASTLNGKLLSSVGARLPKVEAGLIALALENNPRLSERLARMDGARARLNQAKSAYNPNLSLALTAGGQGNTSPSLDSYTEAKAEIVLSIPLYTGGARAAGIDGRNSEYLAAALDRDAALDGVAAAIRSGLQRLHYAREMLKLAKKEHSSTQALLSGIQSERKLGDRSVFDEIRAIGDLAGSEININSARFEVLASELTLAAETGVLGDLFGAALPASRKVALQAG